MNRALDAARLRDRAYDLYLRIAITGSLLVAAIGFTWMWISWIQRMKVIGIAIGWFFGLQVGVMFFVAGGLGFGLVGLIAAGLFEIWLLIRSFPRGSSGQ